MHVPFRILFKYPCRGREKMFFESLDSIYENVYDLDNFHVSCTIDTDDEILTAPHVQLKLREYSNLSIGWGLSDCKISAINRSMPDYDFDILICWSNDMFWTFRGFDDYLRQMINGVFPDMDGLYHLPEMDAKDALNVLFICTRKYYDRFKYIYHPSYKSLWCDNESLAVAKMLNKYHYDGSVGMFIHKNPAYAHHGVERDEKFNYDQSFWGVDEMNFHNRMANNFDLHTLKI